MIVTFFDRFEDGFAGTESFIVDVYIVATLKEDRTRR